MRVAFHLWARARCGLASSELAVSLAALLCLAAVPALAAPPKLTDVRVGVHKKFTRVVLQTDAAVHSRIQQGKDEIRIHLDATSLPRAVAAKSPQLTWVKVSPTAGGSEVRIQLRHPADLKRMVLHKPDRLVLDLYPASHVAKAKPSSPPVSPAPSPHPPATASASTSPSAAGGASAAAGAAAGQAASPLQKQPPGETPPTAPGAEPAPAPPEPGVASPGSTAPGEQAGPEAQAGGESAGGELPSAGSAPAPGGPEASLPQPVPVPPPNPRGGESPLYFLPPPFNQPITLGLIAVLLLAIFVLIRIRRRRVAQESLSPLPPGEEEQELTPVQEIAALGRGREEPETRPAPEPMPPPAPPPAAKPSGAAPSGPGPSAAPPSAPAGEMERRVSHLESRLAEVFDAKERLERQVAAQTEELRVQRAAIARTQRVLRSIARPEDEATEPAPKA